ncbi:hypothetical protein E4U09_001415 [Claviceps aff. purpurea]|uniref:Uncharacterized protein n=1 Tax=Claviceps aff. purpurea TaxID=1967640 RepID=A0A9P7TZF0_9HYPO|nr:hypothetical protein E4U09_001415 [Claviceps aff. purpurea]
MAPRHTPVVRPDDSCWVDVDKEGVLQPLDALSMSDANVKGPNRFAVQRGKMVPQHQCSDVVLLPSQNGYGSIRTTSAHPRRSSRRTQPRLGRESNSGGRSTSSAYSHSDGEQSSPTPEYMLASSDVSRGLAALQISPPSSPEFGGATQGAGDVSPIDDGGNLHRPDLARSHLDSRHIPSQQRKVSMPNLSYAGSRDQNAAARRQAIPPSDGRDRGWPQQGHTHTGQNVNYPDHANGSRDVSRGERPYGVQTTISSSAKDRSKSSSPSFSQRMRLVGKPKPVAFDSRPPWNGASGRSVVVEPVRDDLTVPPLNVPPRVNQRRGHAGASGAAPLGAETLTPSTGGSAMRRLLQGSSKNKPKTTTTRAGPMSIEKQYETTEIPERSCSGPPHIENLAQEAAGSRVASPRGLQTQALGSHPPDLFMPSLHVIKRKPAPVASTASPASTHKAVGIDFLGGPVERLGAGSFVPPARIPLDSRSEATASGTPPSRFSTTTYATSDPGSPRQSIEGIAPPPAVPPPVLSVMDRSRPIASGRSKSSGSQQPIFIAISGALTSTEELQQRQQQLLADNDRNQEQNRSVSDTTMMNRDRQSSMLSTSKPLPLAPNQGKTGDVVSQLDAQINALFHRRINIEKSIKQMTELMPRDNLLASNDVVRKREDEKQKVDNLRQEMAEIQREEHELGLKLYRARKRQEREADYESTPLWVSRVAG